jgi:adenylate cyclase
MSVAETTFHKELEFEKTLSEYKRVKIFTYILAFDVVLALIILGFDLIDTSRLFRSPISRPAVIIWLTSFLVYEAIFLFILKRFINSKISLPHRYRVVHAMIEIIFPGIYIFALTNIEWRPIYIDSPFFFFYFTLICISALQLDFKISFLVGLVAAAQFTFLTYFSFTYVHPVSDVKMAFPVSVYYLRSIILLITGLAAGLIANEINKRVENSFKQLVEKQKIISLFGQQVSKEIVDELIQRKDANIHRINATIMFLDIRNFSTYAETKDPAEIIEFQNNIFNPLIEIISKHKGIVNQFLGDGFMASFGVPIETDDHIESGFKAGLEIINKVNELGKSGKIPETKIGIGLHSGEIITGNVGNDIRKQFSITGTTVITSARLEQLNKQYNTQYLISKEIYNAVSKNGSPRFETMGEIAIKGYEHPLEVICVKV